MNAPRIYSAYWYNDDDSTEDYSSLISNYTLNTHTHTHELELIEIVFQLDSNDVLVLTSLVKKENFLLFSDFTVNIIFLSYRFVNGNTYAYNWLFALMT